MKNFTALFLFLTTTVSVFPHKNADSVLLTFKQHVSHKQIHLALKDLVHLRDELKASNPEKLIDYLHLVQSITESYDEHYLSGFCYSSIGNVYYEQALYFQALEYYFKSFQLYRDNNLDDSLGYVFIDIGNVYFTQGFQSMAENHYRKSFAVFSKTDNRWGKAVTLNNIALINQKKELWDTASYYFHAALHIRQTMNNPYLIAHSYYYLGNLYLLRKQYDTAKEYLMQGESFVQKALQQISDSSNSLHNQKQGFDRTDIQFVHASIYRVLGLLYRELGQHEKAISYFLSSLSFLSEQHKHQDLLLNINIYIDIAETYRHAGDLQAAEHYIRKGLDLSNLNRRPELSLKAIRLLSEILESRGKLSAAHQYLKQYTSLEQTIENQKNLSKITDYETIIVNYENHFLLAQKEQEIRLKDIQTYILLIALVLVTIIGLMLYRINRIKDQARHELEIKNTQISEQSRKLEKAFEDYKTAERQIRKLFTAVEQSANIIEITDIQGHIEYVNPRFTQLTGYTAEEVIGKNPRILKGNPKEPIDYAELWQTILSGEVWRGLFLNKKKDGTEYWEDATISPVRNAGGVIEHFIAIKEDITQRKMVEEALQASEARYRYLVENINDVLFSINREGVITYLSKAIQKVSGYENTDIVGLPFTALIHPEDIPKAEAHFHTVLNGQTDTIELRFITKTKEFLWISISSSPTIQDNHIIGLQGILTDISIRKVAENLQRLDEIRLNALLELSIQASHMNEVDIIRNALEKAVYLTNSKIGYCHLVNEDQQSVELVTWLEETLKICTAVPDRHYLLSHAGVWADCVRIKKPVIHNDYLNLKEQKGLPEGHVKLIRHMSVPVIEEDKSKIIMGVGNKETHYDHADVRQLQLIANETWKLVRRKRLETEREKMITVLQEALSKVKTLSGLLPICASCKKIRDDQGYWHQIENYISTHTDADFSHSICKDCQIKLYPELFAVKPKK